MKSTLDHPDILTPARLPALPSATPKPALNGAATHAHGAHPAHLQHHYDTEQQQYEASKLGMWLFLATELLFFGGLFVLYAIYRGNNPEIFLYGSQYLSTTLGAVNTVVLILSSMTIAFAVRFAQLRSKRGLAIMLGLTLLGGGIFMGIKYFEYSHKLQYGLVWGMGFYGPEVSAAAGVVEDELLVAVAQPAVGDPAMGRNLWMATCLACHGTQGQGMPGQAFDMRDSEFVLRKSDQELVNFIKQGRMPFDPLNRTGIQMPPRGGNPMLKDDQLLDIVAYMRTFEPPAPAREQDDDAAEIVATDREPLAGDAEQEFFILRSSIPHAAEAPRGLSAPWNGDPIEQPVAAGPPDPRTDPNRPQNAHMFFNIYFMLTGLHGLHVLIGMGIIAWLLVMSLGGKFTAGYFTPIELTGLYWHLVDLIWIFLFPLLYLIH